MATDSHAIPFEYKIREAKLNSGPVPAIILLHGYGSHMDDLFSFAPFLPETHTVISLQAPIPLPMGGYAWYEIHFNESFDKWSDNEQALTSISQLVTAIPELCKRHRLKPKDLTLLGFSQGAILSWALALNHPNMIRRIVALSGLINPDLVKTAKPEVTFSAYAAHGTEDPVIPFSWARNSITPFAEQHTQIEFHSYPDGHSVSKENFEAMLRWLVRTKG